jgi:hypothetical protein
VGKASQAGSASCLKKPREVSIDSTPGTARIETDLECCRREISQIEGLLRAGHPDVQGLCLALSDWCNELRLIEQEMKAKRPATVDAGRAHECWGGRYFLIL